MQRLPSVTRDTALFLDFDGTLADLAPRPDLVRVAQGLVPCLASLHEMLDGALAIISGRRLVDLDRFLHPLILPAAGEHGAEQRYGDGRISRAAHPDLAAVLMRAETLARAHAGLQVEPKSASVALHYRHAPELEPLCREELGLAIAQTPGLELMQGKCVLEVKTDHVNKGLAIQAFMRSAPFAGRTPLFAGDDVTDEAGFAMTQALGGVGLKVGEGPSVASHRCDSPQALRSWLHFSIGPLGPVRGARRYA